MGGPAAPAGELVFGDVWLEPAGVVGGERVAHRKAEGSGGGVPGVHGQGFTCLRVCVRAHSLLPKGVVVAIGGFGDGVRVYKGGVGAGTGSDGPFGGPAGEGAFPGNGLAVSRRLDPVEGGAGGDAASGEGFEACRRVRGVGEVGRGPHRREADGGVVGDEGREGGVKEETLTLVGEAPGVGDRGKGRQTAAEKEDVGWPRPPVVKKLTTGPLGSFRQAEAVRVVLSNLRAKAP